MVVSQADFSAQLVIFATLAINARRRVFRLAHHQGWGLLVWFRTQYSAIVVRKKSSERREGSLSQQEVVVGKNPPLLSALHTSLRSDIHHQQLCTEKHDA